MKRLMFGVIAFMAMIILVGCGGEAEKLAAPKIVATIMDTASVTVVWEEDTTVTQHSDFSGYNVYVSTDSTVLLSEDGEDLNAHNTTVITTNSYTATNLSKDSIYYIQVRTVNKDDKVGSYNTSVPFVKASPRPEFTVTVHLELYPNNQNEQNCGLRFETGVVTSESLNVFPGADVFFERFADTLQVNSASRRTASGFSPRTTLMKNFGQKHLDSLYQVTPSEIAKDHEPFVVGDLIVFKTEENNYVKLHIDAYDSTAATVDVTYAYQNKPDFPYFSPGK
ncbi:MAG: fibronectin type III domain-containing protein [candidate division WOR-3 bacterium]